MPAAAERLVALGFQLLPAFEIETHYVIERDGFVALVERKPDGFGGAGSPGLLTEHGFAALVWRGGQAFFVSKGNSRPATSEQVDGLRKFSADLDSALCDKSGGPASNPL
jgi:hypothetical protein